MDRKLTSDYNFVSQFDVVAAEVYRDKKYYFLSLKDISAHRNMDIFDTERAYSKARELLKNREQAWLYGLSKRAKIAILATDKYNSFKSLCDDVMDNNEDLELLPKIGHKVAVEVRGWIIKIKAQ